MNCCETGPTVTELHDSTLKISIKIEIYSNVWVFTMINHNVAWNEMKRTKKKKVMQVKEKVNKHTS